MTPNSEENEIKKKKKKSRLHELSKRRNASSTEFRPQDWQSERHLVPPGIVSGCYDVLKRAYPTQNTQRFLSA